MMAHAMEPGHGDVLPALKPVIPDFQLYRRIGQGSYGDVWLARSVTGAWRAIKIVRRRQGEHEKTFTREFKGIQCYEPVSRSEPSLMAILHVGLDPAHDYFYYVMELADPQSCTSSGSEDCSVVPEWYLPRTLRADLVARGRLSLRECVTLGLTLTSALEVLHGRGLLHRDIKPSNIIFVNGRPKLADIGLVAPAEATMTVPVGTIGYVAPEGPSSPAADLYSLGKVLYEASTGKDRALFPEPVTTLPGEEAEGQLWSELNEVTLKACQLDPRARYTSAAEMREDLALLQAGQSLRRLRAAERRVRLLKKAVVVVVGLTMIGTAAYLYQERQADHFEALAEENRDNLVRLNVSNGLRLLEEGNMVSALPWFVEALRLEQGHPLKEEAHRRRVGAILQQCPKLVAFGIHGGPITSAELSADGTRVLTASADGTARIWQVQNSQPLTLPLQHRGPVNMATFSPDGTRVLTAGADSTAVLWNALTGAAVLRPLQHSAAVTQARFSPDGKIILTVSADRTGKLWRVQDGQPLPCAIQHDSSIESAVFSPDGKLIATGSADGSARIWSAESGEQIGSSLMHEELVRALAFSSDAKWLATGSFDSTARIWDARTGEPLTPPLRHSGPVWQIAFTLDDTRLVSCGGAFKRSGEARVWDVRTGASVCDPVFHRLPVRGVSLSPDGAWFATCSEDQTVGIWELRSAKPVGEPLPQNTSVYGVAFNREGNQLLAYGKDGTWRIWDLVTDSFARLPLVHRSGVWGVGFSPDGKNLLTLSEGEGVFRFETDSLKILQRLGGEYQSTAGFKLTTAGRDLLVSGWNPPRLYDLQTGQQHNSLRPQPLYATDCDLSSDGRYVAAACQENGVLFWDRHSPPDPHFIPTPLPARVTRFSPDGRWLLVGSGFDDPRAMKGEAQIWSTEPLRPSSPPLPHESAVVHAVFTPDSRSVVTTSSDKSTDSRAAHLWKVPQGEDTGIEFRHPDGVTHAAISSDGKYLATAGEEGTARIWELKSGRMVGTPLHHQRGVNTVQFSPDNRRLVTASFDWTARVWDLATGEPLGPPLRHDGIVRAAVFSPDGERVLTGSWDHTVRLWDVCAVHRPLADLLQISELLAGGQAASGALTRLDRSTLVKRFAEVCSTDPALAVAATASRENWHRWQATCFERSHDWKPLLFHLDYLLRTSPQDPELQFRDRRARVEWSREHPDQQPLATADEITRFYPVRDPHTSLDLLDLSGFYNAPLLANWRMDLPDATPLPWPAGVARYGGTAFDVRGIVQLATHYDLRSGYDYPRKVQGIPVHRLARTLYFLHGNEVVAEIGSWMAVFTVHYADGRSVEIPLRYGADVWPLSDQGVSQRRPPGLKAAWEGPLLSLAGQWQDASLYVSAWSNPRPDVPVKSLDFAVRQGWPFLLGVTAQ